MKHKDLEYICELAADLEPLNLGPSQPATGYVVVNAVRFEWLQKAIEKAKRNTEIARRERKEKRSVALQPTQSKWRPTYANARPTQRLELGVRDALREYPEDLPAGFQYDVFVRHSVHAGRDHEAMLLLTHAAAPSTVEFNYRWDKVPSVSDVKDGVLFVLRGWEMP